MTVLRLTELQKREMRFDEPSAFAKAVLGNSPIEALRRLVDPNPEVARQAAVDRLMTYMSRS